MSAPATIPWFVEHATRRVRIVHGEPDDSGFRSDVPGIGRVGDIGHAPAVELAEFIVRACNAHEEMAEALRAALPFARQYGNNGFTAAMIEAALAKAEGR